jgi:TP901 family phage tail tape measure protein
MATAEIGALRVMLGLNAGEFHRGLVKAAKDSENFGSAISKLSDQMNATSIHFNSGIMAAQRFANVVGNIISVTREFSSGMSAVATLVDTGTENMNQMSEAVLAIGRRTPVALSDLTTGLYDLRSAGTTAEDAMERLERSAQLGVAGLGTTKEAVDLVTSSINAFGLTGAEADDVYNNIFKTIQAGKTTISGLAQGFGAVASTVSAAGVPLKEYLASIAALTVTGLPAAVAHTQIRAAIAGMTRESELATKVLSAMGVKTFKELIEKSGGMVNAFNNITKALGNNDANMIKLFGSVEAYNAVLSLTGRQNEAFVANMKKMDDGIDAVTEGFQKRNEGLGASLDKMRNAFQELGIVLGNALTPAIQAISSAVISVTTAFKSLSPELQSAIATIGLIVAVIAPAVAAIAFFVNALGSVVAIAATVGVAIAGLIAVGGPIVAFGVAASAAVTVWNMFQTEIIAIWNAVTDVIVSKVKEIVDWMSRLGSFISQVFGLITSGEFEAAMTRMGEGIAPAVQKAVDAFADLNMTLGLVSVTMETQKQKHFEYSAGVIGSTEAVKESVSGLKRAMSEGNRVFEETMTPYEKMIFKQMELNSLLHSGAIDATTFGRAMAQASAFSGKNMDALASTVTQNLGTIFGETKGVAIATALINTYQGITKALATYPPPISTAMAAIQAAAGFMQVSKIRSQTSKGGGSGGGGGGDSGAAAMAAPAAAVSQTLTVQGISANQMFSGDTMRGLAEQLLEYQRNGGQVILQRT